MRFLDYYRRAAPVISFELFPPKSDKGWADLEERIPRLINLNPAFITVTYGAMGSTRARTLELVSRIRNVHGMEAAHHLTCVGLGRSEIDRILVDIQRAGIQNIVALRGDPPAGQSDFQAPADGYRYANELVSHIRRFGGFGLAVAGYPEKHVEAPDMDADLSNLRRKVDSGADVVITQLFFDNDCFYRFVERCRALGISVPIIPGLLPILNFQQIRRITQMCGSSLPPRLRRELEEAADDPVQVQRIGVRHTINQALDLIESGVDGIHFYVLNQEFHIAEVMEALAGRRGKVIGT